MIANRALSLAKAPHALMNKIALKFSANLGFLWTDRSLPDAIHAAQEVGFDAVECHAPNDYSASDVKAALLETDLQMLSLNTGKGSRTGDNGLAAVVGRESEARSLIINAVDYAAEIGCRNIHVMAGISDKNCAAHDCFLENLSYACTMAQHHNITILIEPLNPHDAPNYYLSSLDEALAVITDLDHSNIKIMFDCYHMQRIHGDIVNLYAKAKNHIGHIQFAGVPDRAEPDEGDVNYFEVLPQLKALGYQSYFGAEYRPKGESIEAGLHWLRCFPLG